MPSQLSQVQPDGVELIAGVRTVDARPLRPYSDLACHFLASVSERLFELPISRGSPDVAAFAFWCRSANLSRLRREFEGSLERIGLGHVFHITPSNVPITFAYSYAFGLLAGNANTVRLPSRHFSQVSDVCGVLASQMQQSKFEDVYRMTSFIRYESDTDITGRYSLNCQARMIWGGDETVSSIRGLPTLPRTIDIPFADRYSLCVLGTDAIGRCTKGELLQLTERFFNDTFVMDQNACSSPHLVVWYGPQNSKTKERFWRALNEVVQKKYLLEYFHAVDKFTRLCHDAIIQSVWESETRYGNNVYVISLRELPGNTESFRGKFGYFYEYETFDLNILAPVVTSKTQTLTYFGIEKKLLLEFVYANRLKGIDRLVEVGRALDLGVIWDGFELIKTLTRVIYVDGSL